MKNILFVCSGNVDRSKTAEDFYAQKIASLEFRSAGTNHDYCIQHGTHPLLQSDVDWADLILVMETKHLDWIHKNLQKFSAYIEVLNIPDRYKYYSKELIELLQKTCPRYF
jgi:predicted protein tyrosine phosphatase